MVFFSIIQSLDTGRIDETNVFQMLVTLSYINILWNMLEEDMYTTEKQWINAGSSSI